MFRVSIIRRESHVGPGIQIYTFYLYRNLTLGFFLLVGLGHIDGTSSSVFAVSIEVEMKLLVRSIGDHLRSQNFYPRARKICANLDAHQDIIGHNAPVRSQILPEYHEYDTFEGHGKDDVTSKVSNPPFTNLGQRCDATKNPCSLDDFLVAELPIKPRFTAL